MLNRVYELETAIFRSSAKEAELAEALKQAKFGLRQARIAQVEYGGIRAFADKLSCKYADKVELLSRDVRKAEAELSVLEGQLEAQRRTLSSLQEQRTSLPPLPQLQTEETKDLWAPLERRYCAECLLPLLDNAKGALTEYRQMLRGEIPMLSIGEQQSISAAPIKLAQECQPLLQRLEKAALDFPSTDFFRTPAGFLAAAARHNQLERAVDADAQLRKLKSQLTRLLQSES